MSKSSFTGVLKNFSPKPDEGYYGILVDNGQEEKWLNGEGSIPSEWSKGDKVKVKTNQDQFIDIKKIDVIKESSDNEGAQSAGSDRGENTDSYIPPELQVALKEACETSRQANLDLGDERERAEHIDLVKSLTNGYYNILQDLGGDSK